MCHVFSKAVTHFYKSTTNTSNTSKFIYTFIDNFRSRSYIQDRSITVGATRRKQIMIIWFTVRASIALKEVPSSKFLGAMSACEVLRMPRTAEGRDNLSNYRLVTSSTTAFLGSGDSLAGHVSVQWSKHTFQNTTRCVLRACLPSTLHHFPSLLLLLLNAGLRYLQPTIEINTSRHTKTYTLQVINNSLLRVLNVLVCAVQFSTVECPVRDCERSETFAAKAH